MKKVQAFKIEYCTEVYGTLNIILPHTHTPMLKTGTICIYSIHTSKIR